MPSSPTPPHSNASGSGPLPRPTTVSEMRRRLAAVQERIDAAARGAGRDPREVRLLPVSKTHPADTLLVAQEAGVSWFGENKVQEAQAKAADPRLASAQWSLIGHLQTNKAKFVADFATEFQALDSLRVAQELNKRLAARQRTLRVLVQVNTSQEEQKFGVAPQAAAQLVDQVLELPNLELTGLMTVAVHSPDQSQVAGCFDRLVRLQDQLASRAEPGQLRELSMGMSGDFELAIAHGSTCVRIGQSIFGARDYQR